MGRGSSKVSGGGGGSAGGQTQRQDFKEAFQPGKDYEAVGGVDHDVRTVSRTTQAEWDAYASLFGSDISSADERALMKDWDGRNLYGYIRTTNGMAINKQLCDNQGKTPDQIFSKRTKQGKNDRATVDALDRAINSHTTPADGMYYRFCNQASLQRSYGLSSAEISQIMNAPNMTPSQLAQLNSALRGSRSTNPGYTSVSANRSLNAFKNPTKKQSVGYTIERRISVPGGTNAYAPKRNAQESEVIFGRNMSLNFSHISVEGRHIVVHEYY